MPTLTKEIIEAAIAGFEGQKDKIDAQIAELRAMLTGTPAVSAATALTKGTRGGKRKFSAEAIKRMREAQQRRWAAVRGESAPSTPATTKSQSKKPPTAPANAPAA